MDLDHPWALFSGLLIGTVGFAVFMYGKKQANPRCLGIGVALSVFPYFVSSLLLMWALAAAFFVALYASARHA